MKLSDFNYDVSKDLIALQSQKPRDAARMLVIEGNSLKDSQAFELPNYIEQGDLIVLNDTKVIPSRLIIPER